MATTLPHNPIFQLKTVRPYPDQTAGDTPGPTPGVSAGLSSQHWPWQDQARVLRPCVTTGQRPPCTEEKHGLLDPEAQCQPQLKSGLGLGWSANIQKGDGRRKASVQATALPSRAAKNTSLMEAPTHASPASEGMEARDSLLERAPTPRNAAFCGSSIRRGCEHCTSPQISIHALYANCIHFANYSQSGN